MPSKSNTRHSLAIVLVAIGFFISSCGGGSSSSTPQPSPTRTFYMGFTPWPYDATTSAVDDTYVKIQDNGDLVAHHLDGGIPWQASLSGSAYHANVQGELAARVAKTQSGKIVYLAANPLNVSRTNIADHWGASTEEALTPPWNGYTFSDANVIQAYINYSLDLITRFNPRYFNYAIEINELMVNNPTAFDAFVTFSQQVYTALKAAHPNLPLMVSIALKTPGSSEMMTAQAGFDRIKDYVDIVGVSSYGYVFYSHANKGDPANLPANWLSQIQTIAPGKPIAIAETGWIAEDLNIAAFSVSEMSDASKQDAYLDALLTRANSLNAQFVVWFSVVDYDALWTGTLGQSDIAKIWRDTGLYDNTLQPRTGLTRWQTWFARTRQ